MKKHLIAYTDGSYQSSINCMGSSAYLLDEDGPLPVLYMGWKGGTNNRAELKAVLLALYYTADIDCVLDIYTDSNYVITCVNFAEKWFKEEDYDKKNLDLCYLLLEYLKGREVYFHWVKGHELNEYNNKADLLAVHAAQCMNLPTDYQRNVIEIIKGRT